MKRYFLFAGEASGDLHGSHLIQALRTLEKEIHLCGVGGPRMRKTDFECLIEMEQFQVMGLTDVLKSLPHLYRKFHQTKNLILKINPDIVILIDYPGFNLRLASALREAGFRGKLVQYICPTVWAHSKRRIETLASNYDLLLTIFPFEAAYFIHTPLRVKYIGNPLVETIRASATPSNEESLSGLPNNENLIALFPGSRLAEIQRHAPQQLRAAALLKKRYPHFQFALACAQENFYENLCHMAQKCSLSLNKDLFIVSSSFHYELMQRCYLALAKSGTVTLELALHAVPTVVHYELSTLNYFYAKFVLRLQLPHYCIVNILGEKSIFPELIGRNISPIALQNHLESLHCDLVRQKKIKTSCQELKVMLEAGDAHQNAAHAILELIHS